MIVYGYAKDNYYTNDGTLLIRVRIPSIHGAYNQREYRGQQIKNYTTDNELPYYPSLLLPHLPNEGEVVALASLDSSGNNFLVIGLTGGFYDSVNTDVSGSGHDGNIIYDSSISTSRSRRYT